MKKILFLLLSTFCLLNANTFNFFVNDDSEFIDFNTWEQNVQNDLNQNVINNINCQNLNKHLNNLVNNSKQQKFQVSKNFNDNYDLKTDATNGQRFKHLLNINFDFNKDNCSVNLTFDRYENTQYKEIAFNTDDFPNNEIAHKLFINYFNNIVNDILTDNFNKEQSWDSIVINKIFNGFNNNKEVNSLLIKSFKDGHFSLEEEKKLFNTMKKHIIKDINIDKQRFVNEVLENEYDQNIIKEKLQQLDYDFNYEIDNIDIFFY